MIGWVTHIDPGYHSGGAEMSDADMLSQCPGEYRIVRPWALDALDGCDAVVVAGAEKLDAAGIARVLEFDPVMWAHGWQGRQPHCLPLFEEAREFIALSERHLRWEQEWIDRDRWQVNRGWFDTSDCYAEPKDIEALWAHRFVAHKGLPNAHRWARDNGVELTSYSGLPRDEVLALMRRSKRFLLLPTIRDGGPRAVHEAAICGCEVITNDYVGFDGGTPAEVRERIDSSAERFWSLVCES